MRTDSHVVVLQFFFSFFKILGSFLAFVTKIIDKKYFPEIPDNLSSAQIEFTYFG